MEALDEMYIQILDPVNFVKNFSSLHDFKYWASMGSVLDLQEAIKVFEEHELYEHCAIMRDLIIIKNVLSR